ncbi:hypothetical protein ABZY16_30365 [Streptomyces sp. NPDC006553]|uniref:hypothetical protein n=1 Tax=unclassified Streptomyces TaxID=2593676 RepID=UPI002251B39D|nr:hypothetical protein [Streptomyces sp. NBC_00233]MCX5228727.1 hypothetical protein [Streptomyces sp. NBC_00233]
MGLYIETRVRADLETLWERTQEPGRHQRWDLRFTEIDHLPRAGDEPQRFRYATRVLPFLVVAGTGVSAGERHRAGGDRVSALRFASPHPLSLLAEGSGYWRYVPTADGVRFLTGYDYRPRWGRLGRLADRLVFRPLMGWATAWSFDRLRLWCERGITPERSRNRWLLELLARMLLVAVPWAATALPLGLVSLAAVPLTVLGLALAVRVPPSPRTPAARRCLRTPPARTREPRLLAALEQL